MKNNEKKKNGLKATKILAGITTASIIANPSCSPADDLEGDDLYKKETIINESELGDTIIPLSIKLKPEDIGYISAIQRLSNDIIKNKDIAKNYVNNPTEVLRVYGYNGLVKEDDYLLKIVLAFGDDEINEAINNKDIALYLKLCKKKGILQENNRGSIFTDDFYQKQIRQLDKLLNPKNIQKRLGFDDDNFGNFDGGDSGLFAVAALGVVIVAGVGILATVGAVFTTYAIAGHTTYVYAKSVSQESDILGSIYMLKSEDKNYYLLMDEERNKIVDATISYIKAKNPKYFETNSEETLKNIIRYNIKNK